MCPRAVPLHTRFDESGLLAGIRLISIHLLGESIANVALKEREKVSERASIWEHASFRVGTLRTVRYGYFYAVFYMY